MGHIGNVHAEVEALIAILSTRPKNSWETICEVGFNAGHSAVLWLHETTSAHLHVFDWQGLHELRRNAQYSLRGALTIHTTHRSHPTDHELRAPPAGRTAPRASRNRTATDRRISTILNLRRPGFRGTRSRRMEVRAGAARHSRRAPQARRTSVVARREPPPPLRSLASLVPYRFHRLVARPAMGCHLIRLWAILGGLLHATRPC